MLLTLSAIVIGLAIGLLSGGSLHRLAETPIRNAWLMLVGLLLPAVVDRFDFPGSTLVVLVAIMAVAAFAVSNLHLVGMGVVLVGLLMNLVPVALNGAMPVRAEALVAAGFVDEADVDRATIAGPRRLERPDDHLTFLGDIIPLRLTKQVVSFGDLVILIGVADITANLVRRRRKRHAASDDSYTDRNDTVLNDTDLNDTDQTYVGETVDLTDSGESVITMASAAHD